MNIVKLQNDLKNVPDQALIGYVQNPTGQVPSYLALSELQRRKEMREKYQKQEAPQQSVAEDLQQQSQPGGLAMLAKNPAQGNPTMSSAPTEPGVAGLPTGDMYQEQNFASGGIIAFDNGGSVWDKARNYLLPPSPSTIRDLQGKTRMSPFMGGMGDLEAYKYADPNYLLKKREMLYQQLDQPGADKNAIYEQINAIDQQTRGPAGGYVPAQKPAMTDAEVAAKNIIAQTDQNKTPVVNPYAVDTSIPKPLTVEEAINREKEAMRLAGVDTEFYKKQMEEMAKDREALGKDKTQAGWMALARAGLGMAAGKSPFALQNIAAGATEGLEQYGKETKDLRAEQRLLKAADLKLAEAQNAQQRGDAQSALKAIQERDKIISDLKERRMATSATLEAARISAGSRTGIGQLPALYGALNKAQQAGNQPLVDQIQSRIDEIEAGGAGGSSTSSAGWSNFQAVKPAK